MRLFEISDVVLLEPNRACGAANVRRLVAVNCDRSAAFEVVHGLLNRVMEVLRVPYLGKALGGPAGGRRAGNTARGDEGHRLATKGLCAQS